MSWNRTKSCKRFESSLPRSYIYYARSHEGCGCAFGYQSIEEIRSWGLPEDVLASALRARQQSVHDLAALREYLTESARLGPLRLLVTWMGDEERPLSRYRRVDASYFGGDSFSFKDPELFDVESQ
jgi:hypothetical protein